MRKDTKNWAVQNSEEIVIVKGLTNALNLAYTMNAIIRYDEGKKRGQIYLTNDKIVSLMPRK